MAEKMGTTQSTVARLESGGTMPSLRSLYRYVGPTPTHELFSCFLARGIKDLIRHVVV
ncbi:MAG: helix-turn-helix domain-containing protein, partial [Desulfonatronovibrionaceae bacterium]